jgi:hypothetical protein
LLTGTWESQIGNVKGVAMGQAALDLPDPLEQPPATAAGTDDLLAQLAGEEIDRLLAESESDNPPPTQQNPPAAQELLLPTVAGDSATQSKPEVSSAAQLEGYLEELATASATSPHEVDPVTRLAEPAAPVAPSKPSAATATPLDDDETLAAERGALNTVEPDLAPVEAALAAGLSTETTIRSEAKVAFYLRLLGWLNAPLDSCSDTTRDLIGKIAILTAVNALSVLVYLLFFRRHG